jgi:hypothetical protein
MDGGRIAELLKMDSTKYYNADRQRQRAAFQGFDGEYNFNPSSKDGMVMSMILSNDILNMGRKFKDLTPFTICCQYCSAVQIIPPQLDGTQFGLVCSSCQMDYSPGNIIFCLRNFIRLQHALHAQSLFECVSCQFRTREISTSHHLTHKLVHCTKCGDKMRVLYSAERLYIQLIFLKEIFTSLEDKVIYLDFNIIILILTVIYCYYYYSQECMVILFHMLLLTVAHLRLVFDRK